MSLAAMDAKTASTLECCTPGAVVVVAAGVRRGGSVADSLGADCSGNQATGLHVMWL